MPSILMPATRQVQAPHRGCPNFVLCLRLSILLLLIPVVLSGCGGPKPRAEMRLLVFSKTMGYRHASIAAGQQALFEMGETYGFAVDTTEDATYFTEERLSRYSAVVFLNTTGDVLDLPQQVAFERYIQAGGGYVGVHAATDTEYDWPWYGRLAGAYFASHPNNPNVREAEMQIVDHAHPSTSFFGEQQRWTRQDEFYNFRQFYQDEKDGIRPLVMIDETTYEGGTNGDYHPMSWYHDFDGGRAWYTNFGHTDETYAEPLFRQHLWGGIQYAVGPNLPPDFSRARSLMPPDPDRFLVTTLAENLNEPMELEVMRDGRILFTERRGAVKSYDPQTGDITQIAQLDVYNGQEDGLVGLALDPRFDQNHWVYLYYAPAGEEAKFNLSRFTMRGDTLHLPSERVLLEVATQREQCCHTGGSIEFDGQGLLYLSTGDDTNPFETRYAPINQTPGRSPWDAQKSSANPNDLRGKVLRIKPNDYGGYEIPDGNLFPKDGSQGRPEIYVMGCRNPYRISIDDETGFLYWGDVGPDGQVDSLWGPRGYDEVNQARQPGFFGWPYFIANNRPYRQFDFQTQTLGDWFNPIQPVNYSPNNTGIKNLPPAQPAFIYYPYAASPEFPILGQGGRNAMAGPVYHYKKFKGTPSQFPRYFDNKLFIYDFMRDWIMLVTMNEAGDLMQIDPFIPEKLSLSSPIDMTFGPDGALYVLEYGTRWFAANSDARLTRIDYAAGNRAPIARIDLDATVGAAPFTVALSASRSLDYDTGDQLSYRWDFGNGQTGEGETATATFAEPGIYQVSLVVRDQDGYEGRSQREVRVGNAPPQIDIQLTGNRSFFWDGTRLPYRINVTDAEDGSLSDGSISSQAVSITFDYLEGSADPTEGAQGHAAVANAALLAAGEELITEAGCIACHGFKEHIVGPSYFEVAQKYETRSDAVAYLVGKIINGGIGVWGGKAMPAQQQVSPEDARKMALYIRSLNQASAAQASLPTNGSLRTDQHRGLGAGSTYTLRVSYTDQGGDPVGPLSAHQSVILRSPRLQPGEVDPAQAQHAEVYEQNGTDYLVFMDTGYAAFGEMDLSGLRRLSLRYAGTGGGQLEFRLDAPDGPLLAQHTIAAATSAMPQPQTVELDLKDTSGFHTLYLVARKSGDADFSRGMFAIEWLYFQPPPN